MLLLLPWDLLALAPWITAIGVYVCVLHAPVTRSGKKGQPAELLSGIPKQRWEEPGMED